MKKNNRERSPFCQTLLMDGKNLVETLNLEIVGKLKENKWKLRLKGSEEEKNIRTLSNSFIGWEGSAPLFY